MVDVNKVASAFKDFAEEIKAIVMSMMEERGVNEKINENTLVNSHIYNELKTNNPSFELIEFFINDYVKFIESGRRPGAKMPPIEALVPWARERGISTDNRTLYAIARSIAIEGIKPRLFLDDSFEMLDKYWDSFSDDLFGILTGELDEFFSD